MTIRQHRLIQWIAIALIISVGAGWYFQYRGRAAVTERRISDTGLTGYWSLDDGTGTQARDFSSNGNHGTLTNMESGDWVDGKKNKALTFDGVDEYVVATNTGNAITNYNVSRTVSVWFQASATGSQRGIASAADTFGDTNPLWIMLQTSGNKLAVYHGSDYRIGTTTLSTGTWYLATYTFNASDNSVKLYLNGTQEYSGTVVDSNFNKGSIFIGSGYGGRFSGMIDEARIYNRALSQTEVTTLYQQTIFATKINSSQNNKVTNGLVGQWSFDGADVYSGGSYTTAFSYTGSAQTFTVPSGVTTVTVKMWGPGGGANGSNSGGAGGYSTADISVTPEEDLTVIVGGGGAGSSNLAIGGAGGGASSVKRGATRLIIAGGGGGTGGVGGAGGGSSGADGVVGGSKCTVATGGSQAAVGTGALCSRGNGVTGLVEMVEMVEMEPVPGDSGMEMVVWEAMLRVMVAVVVAITVAVAVPLALAVLHLVALAVPDMSRVEARRRPEVVRRLPIRAIPIMPPVSVWVERPHLPVVMAVS